MRHLELTWVGRTQATPTLTSPPAAPGAFALILRVILLTLLVVSFYHHLGPIVPSAQALRMASLSHPLLTLLVVSFYHHLGPISQSAQALRMASLSHP